MKVEMRILDLILHCLSSFVTHPACMEDIFNSHQWRPDRTKASYPSFMPSSNRCLGERPKAGA